MFYLQTWSDWSWSLNDLQQKVKMGAISLGVRTLNIIFYHSQPTILIGTNSSDTCTCSSLEKPHNFKGKNCACLVTLACTYCLFLAKSHITKMLEVCIIIIKLAVKFHTSLEIKNLCGLQVLWQCLSWILAWLPSEIHQKFAIFYSWCFAVSGNSLVLVFYTPLCLTTALRVGDTVGLQGRIQDLEGKWGGGGGGWNVHIHTGCSIKSVKLLTVYDKGLTLWPSELCENVSVCGVTVVLA